MSRSERGIPPHLVAQIKSDFSDIARLPRTRFLAFGVDSHVFLINPVGQQPIVYKLYDRSPLTREHIQRYADLTNSLQRSLVESPFIDQVILGGEAWKITFSVNPVLNLGETSEKIPFTRSPFVEGDTFEHIAAEVRRKLDNGMEAYVSEPNVHIISTRENRKTVPFPKSHVHELFDQTYWISSGNRTEKKFDEYMNRVLQTQDLNVQPLNIKPRIDLDSKSVQFVITDIEGTISALFGGK